MGGTFATVTYIYPSEIYVEIFDGSTRHIGLNGSTYGVMLIKHRLPLNKHNNVLYEALEASHGVFGDKGYPHRRQPVRDGRGGVGKSFSGLPEIIHFGMNAREVIERVVIVPL